ncbi:holo-ACP synthase [Demequina sp. SYSU T00192]|uniref:Holo-[acyl-carrier-protein] synthase n=1 Tax=Demequina litoralis TaxID=3051660 RepID=A0ABT8G7B6_9MICO|nr:holo-ACP synthase [Demequina sp. SYSU T00192]MDN4475040.1 holo-ACP synthase [Demequina sp. SYSU T00192]
MAILGLGIDVVEIARFEDALERSPGFLERVFTPAERELGHASLAARWAAKEALAKALGAPAGLSWQDCEVTREDGGQPRLLVTGTVAARVAALGMTSLHVSLSHDAGIASAVVIGEG